MNNYIEYYNININYECYECVNNCGWSLKELSYGVRQSRFYKTVLSKFSNEAIILRAFIYAKKNEYLDMIMQRLSRKNGNDFANQIFKEAFPMFNNINDLYKYCYDACVNSEDLKSVSKEIGIFPSMIRYYAKESKLGELKEDEERYEKKVDTIKNNYKEHYEAVEFLMNHDKKEDIIAYFENQKEKFLCSNLIKTACTIYKDRSFDEIKEQIETKYNIYKRYKKYILDANSSIKENAYNYISKFVKGSYPSVNYFCEIEDITKSRFGYYYTLTKKYNQELYKEYIDKMIKIKNGECHIDKKELREIVKCITYGIDGREFNIIDFFNKTNYTLREFYFYVRDLLSYKELHEVRNFYNKYKNMEIYSYRDIMKEKREFYCDLDKDGLPISGTGHVVTRAEKEEIMRLIKNDGYELYGPIYNIYLKNYFNDEKRKVLKKSL